MKVLHWNYKKTGNDILDALAFGSVASQQDIADVIGKSVATVERKIAKLKKDGLLKIWRLKDNDIYYCIGDDASAFDAAFEAKATYTHRQEMYEDGAVTVPVSTSGIVFDKPEDLVDQAELEIAVTKLGY